MTLHIFHMTNYTIQKKEGGGSVQIRRKGRRRRRKNNDEEDEETAQVFRRWWWERGWWNRNNTIISSCSFSLYQQVWSALQPVSPSPSPLFSNQSKLIVIAADFDLLWRTIAPPRLLETFWWFGLEVTQPWTTQSGQGEGWGAAEPLHLFTSTQPSSLTPSDKDSKGSKTSGSQTLSGSTSCLIKSTPVQWQKPQNIGCLCLYCMTTTHMVHMESYTPPVLPSGGSLSLLYFQRRTIAEGSTLLLFTLYSPSVSEHYLCMCLPCFCCDAWTY